MATDAASVGFHPAAAAMHWWSDKTTAFMPRLHLAAKVRQPETFRHISFDLFVFEREMWRL